MSHVDTVKESTQRSAVATLPRFSTGWTTRSRGTSKHYSAPYEGHLWFFNAVGKVVKYQHITDTALHQRAAKGE